ncbi:hypothetical protein, partial [Ferrithrix thermotolerans]|uniref:hypothetical protein n=1 Tax=Ferrithrix thermotolerans TaxID=209649 RepID=UPI001C49E14B
SGPRAPTRSSLQCRNTWSLLFLRKLLRRDTRNAGAIASEQRGTVDAGERLQAITMFWHDYSSDV